MAAHQVWIIAPHTSQEEALVQSVVPPTYGQPFSCKVNGCIYFTWKGLVICWRCVIIPQLHHNSNSGLTIKATKTRLAWLSHKIMSNEEHFGPFYKIRNSKEPRDHKPNLWHAFFWDLLNWRYCIRIEDTFFTLKLCNTMNSHFHKFTTVSFGASIQLLSHHGLSLILHMLN